MRTTNAAQAADRLQQILQWQPDSLAALAEVEPLLDIIEQAMPLLRLWATAEAMKRSDLAESFSSVDALAQDLDDGLALDHHLQLVEFFATSVEPQDLKGLCTRPRTYYNQRDNTFIAQKGNEAFKKCVGHGITRLHSVPALIGKRTATP